MRIAVLGPGGVGGLLAGVLDRAGSGGDGGRARADRGGDRRAGHEREQRDASGTSSRGRARCASLTEPVDALLVATKAAGLQGGARAGSLPSRVLVLPLLNGLDHLAVLRERFQPELGARGHDPRGGRPARAGRGRAHQPVPARDMATAHASAAAPHAGAGRGAVRRRGARARPRGDLAALRSAGDVVEARAAQRARLHDQRLRQAARRDPLHAAAARRSGGGDRGGAAPSGARRARYDVEPSRALDELERAHGTLGSSMQRDIAAGRPPELDAIPGSVLRAAARHGLRCPTIARLVAVIADRAGVDHRGSRTQRPEEPPPGRAAPSSRRALARKGVVGSGSRPARSPGAPRVAIASTPPPRPRLVPRRARRRTARGSFRSRRRRRGS